MNSELSAKQRSALQRVMDDVELQPWLFKKVNNPIWFDAFIEKGLFSPELNPRPVETKVDTFQIPSWPITEYLVSSSLKIEEADLETAQKYMSLLRDVTKYAIDNAYSNYRTWWQFSKVLRNIPISIISLDDVKYIRFWLTDKLDKHLVGKEISEWISELADKKDKHSRKITISLLDVLFTITSIENRYSGDRKEAVLNFDSYQANEFVKKSAKRLGEQLDLSAVVLFERKLIELLDINNNDKWSNLWRNAIEEHTQNSRHVDADDIILKLFRDSMLGYYQSNREDKSETKLIKLLNSEYETIKRIAIYISSECFEYLEESTIEQVITKSHFNDKFRHELWHFLNQNFVKLTEAYQTSVIEAISNLEVKNEDNVIEAKPTAYKQANWYAAIVEADELTRQHYQQCIEITGVEPEHPDFSCYTSGGVVINESPLSVTELAVMLDNPTELVQFLNGYDHVGHFGEAGLEGLVETFSALVSLDGCFILNNLDHFSELAPHYLHEIFSSYLKLWTGKKQCDWDSLWPKLIDFAHELFQSEIFWQSPTNEESGPFIGDVHWVVSVYSRLIESGCNNDANAFDLSLCETAKQTLEFILEHESGSDFDKDLDAVSIAINSPRGRCLESYFKLALYQCRNVEKDSEEHEKIWATYESIFTHELSKPNTSNEYEFITLVVMYIRNFLYLSKNWSLANLEKMFAEIDSLQWLCAVQAYSHVGRLIPEIHEIFKVKGYYFALLDSSNLKDSVKGRFIEYICIAHLQEIEKIDDDLLTNLVSRGNDKELSKLIWFLWSVRDQKIEATKKLVFWLWPKLVELIKAQTGEQKTLASKLGLWIEYIEYLDEKSKSWLLEISPFINNGSNNASFMKELARLSNLDALGAADIWKKTLPNPFYVYDLEPLKQIFKNLYALGEDEKAAASEIAGEYVKNNDEAVVKLYQKVFNE